MSDMLLVSLLSSHLLWLNFTLLVGTVAKHAASHWILTCLAVASSLPLGLSGSHVSLLWSLQSKQCCCCLAPRLTLLGQQELSLG